jgi:hypothetical protein
MTHGVHRGSVLPKISVTHSRGTTILGAKPVTWFEVVGIVVCVVAVALNAYVVTLDVYDLERRIEAGTAVVTSLLLAIILWRHYRSRAPLQWASLRFRHWPLRLGQEVRAELRGSLEGAPVSHVAATLECREEVHTGRGDMGTTKNAIRYAIELVPPDRDVEGTHLTARWTFTIPPDQPPSLVVQSNVVRWRLLIRITTSEGTEVPADFELLVLPEVVA